METCLTNLGILHSNSETTVSGIQKNNTSNVLTPVTLEVEFNSADFPPIKINLTLTSSL
jgi:hypothetical protein